MKYMLFLLILISSISFAGVYKWVDKDGNVKFSQFPPEDVQIESEEMTITPNHAPSINLSEEDIVGYWRCINVEGDKFDLTINKDHTLSINLNGSYYGKMHGTWKLQGTKMNTTMSGYLEKNRQRKNINKLTGFEVFTFVSENKLKSTDGTGKTTQYKRI
jgi:hypothetical protein